MSTELVARFRDKRFIGTTDFRCGCCGSGFPCCADIEATTGERYKHDEVCRRIGPELCASCEIRLALRHA